MTWIQELRDLGADEIARRLGGRRVANNDWRLPYLCKREQTLTDNPGFTIWQSGGWIRAHCHHCEAPGMLGLVYEALFGYQPLALPNERRGHEVSIGRPYEPDFKSAVDVALELGLGCAFCGQETSYVEVLNGWPTPRYCAAGCNSHQHTYDEWLKRVVEICKKTRFTCQYHAANGDLLESVREEPGKNIWGKGSNSKLRPLPLLWSANHPEHFPESDTGLVVIVEGEKAAAALHSHRYNAISWRGGKGAWKHTNWEGIEAPWHLFKTIVFWPDYDDGSHDAFYQLGLHLPKNDHQELLIVRMTDSLTDKKGADAADFTGTEVFRLLKDHLVSFSEWASSYVFKPITGDPLMVEDDESDDDWPEDIPEIYRRGGYYDVLRIRRYLADDLAHVQVPGDRGLTTTLAWADRVGYWHPLNDERNSNRLLVAISESRTEALLEMEKDSEALALKQSTRNKVMKDLENRPNRRDLQEAVIQLTAQLVENELYNHNKFNPLPQYTLQDRRRAAASGLLTFKGEVIALPSQGVLRKADVREYGILFDEGWSDCEWQPGAYEANTPQAKAVRTLIENLGDFPLIVAEMLAGMDRRIAILHSKTSGVGKSMFTGLLKSALGSMVETGQPGELTKRAMGSQFPNLNNHLTRCRVLVIPEVNTAGLENINFGKLVHLTGEADLTTERKYMENTTLPRTGNVLLTMGEVQKLDAKNQPAIKWHEIQGLETRLRVWDIDAGGGKKIADHYYDDANTWEGRLALVDWLVQSMGDGKPDSYTSRVSAHTDDLFNTSRDVPLKESSHSKQVELRDDVIRKMTEWTGEYDPPVDVCDLAKRIETKLEEEGWEPALDKATDQAWLSSIRRVYDLPSLRNLELEGERNRRRKDRRGSTNWPVRGFRFKEADEYDAE